MYKLAYNNDLTTNAFSCSLPNAVPIDKAVISLNSNKYKNTTDQELYYEDINVSATVFVIGK